jgi:hypothetical protein
MKNSLSTSNLIIILILILILLLVYLKSGKLELFNEQPFKTVGQPTTNNIIKNSSIMNFINTYAKKQQQHNYYKAILNNKQIQLNSMSDQVLSLINPS